MKTNWFIYTLLLVLSLVFVYIYNESASFIFFNAIILCPVFSLVWLHILKLCVVVEECLKGDLIIKKENNQYCFRIKNKGFWPVPYIKLHFLTSPGFQMIQETPYFPLRPRSVYEKEYSVVFHYTGLYAAGGRQIEFIDFFGLFTARRILKEPLKVCVYPELSILEKKMAFYPQQSEQAHAAVKKTQADVSGSGVRPYIPGDELKRIHWKLTAKTGHILSREPETEEQAKIQLYFDLKKMNYSEKESIIVQDRIREWAACFSYEVLSKGFSVDFIFSRHENRHCLHVYHLSMFHMMYQCIAEMEFNQEFKAENLLMQQNRINQKSSFLITNDPCLSLCKALDYHKAALVYFISEEDTDKKEKENNILFLSSRGIQVYSL